MCLLVLAWRCHPQHRLVVAANRDEFHARPAAGLAPWDDAPDIIGGRDLQANGAWLAVDRRGRFGIVTNFREFGRRRAAPSRGGLIPAFLRGVQAPGVRTVTSARRGRIRDDPRTRAEFLALTTTMRG